MNGQCGYSACIGQHMHGTVRWQPAAAEKVAQLRRNHGSRTWQPQSGAPAHGRQPRRQCGFIWTRSILQPASLAALRAGFPCGSWRKCWQTAASKGRRDLDAHGRQRMWRQLGGRVSARRSEHLGQGRLRPTAGAARPAGGRRHWSFAWVRGCLPLGQQRRKPIAVSGCARREERCWRRSARVPFHTHLRKPWCRSCACTAITRLNTGSETGASRNRSIRDWHLLRTNLRRYRTPFPSTALIVTLD